MKESDTALICIEEKGRYTVFLRELPGIITEVDKIEEAPRKIANMLEDILTYNLKKDINEIMIADSFGNMWSKRCPECKKMSMQIVRPGKVQCKYCG